MAIANIGSYGAVGDGVTDCTTAIQNCINANDCVLIDPGTYLITAKLILPQSKMFSIQATGFRQCTILDANPNGEATLEYVRQSGVSGGICDIRNLNFIRQGNTKTVGSSAIKSFGYSDSQSDNAIRIQDCSFYGYDSAICTKWTGGGLIQNCYAQYNTRFASMQRGSSAFKFYNCFGLDNSGFILAQDVTHDAFSNGLEIVGCDSILCTANDLLINGWQAVFIQNCGFDLGYVNSGESLGFYYCQDVHVDGSWISSTPGYTRDGVRFDNSHSSTLTNSTIVNCSIGSRIFGTSGLTTAIKIDGIKFDGNIHNDIVLQNYSTGCKLINNHHNKQMARTGTDYEIYGNTTGTAGNVVLCDTFKGSAYTLNVGTNSVVSGNIFGV